MYLEYCSYTTNTASLLKFVFKCNVGGVMVFNISVISVTSVISVISVISWWSVLLENPGKTTGLTKSLTNFMHAQKRTNNVKVNLI